MPSTLIAQLSDPHVTAPGLRLYDRVDTCAALARAVAAVGRLARTPDAVLISGDLTGDGQPQEYQQLRALLAPLRCPVYLMAGNHDDRGALRAAFPEHPWLHGPAGFVQYAAQVGELRLLCLDSTVPGHGHGELCADRLDWLAQALDQSPGTPTLVALHHPPFRTHIVPMDRMGLRRGDEELRAIVARHHQVERVLCGHLHRAIQARFAGSIVQTAPSTAHQIELALQTDGAGAFVLEPPGFLLHLWDSQTGLVTHQVVIDEAAGPFQFRGG